LKIQIRGFTSCLDGPNEKGIVCGTGAWNIGDIKKSDVMNTTLEMGKTV
jgi:hypothetical protein